ncbi:MAG: PAS domain-containing protein [Sandaracinus sp.]|nr:PAS domain-containing protein [Sandaracinus sp.]
MLAYLTVINYALLSVLWTAAFVLYVRGLRVARRSDPLVATLVAVLSLDAFKSAFESYYFGAVWSAQYDIALEDLGTWLQQPHLLIVPKILNTVVATSVLVVVVRRWIPQELEQRREHAESERRLREELAASLEETRRVAERWNLALSANQDGIWDWIVDTGEVWVSPRFEEQLGYAHGELDGIDFSYIESILHPEDRPRVLRTAREFLDDRIPTYDLEFRLRAKDGSYRTVRSRGVALRDEQGRAVRMVGSHADVTEHRQAEVALQRRRKIETVGLVAGGVAHDVNNLLAVIRANAEMARRFVTAGSPADRALRDVDDAVVRGATLTSRLLAASGRGRFTSSDVDLGELARETARLLASSAPEGVAVEVEAVDSVPPIEADGAQLQQVVMNLLTNAIDAVDQRGHVRVKVWSEDRDEPSRGTTPDDPPLPPGRYVVLRVEDDGSGMDAAVQTRIFEPFYTTKPEGRGLGLSAMLETLRAHRGGLVLESEPGKGTTFTLSFAALERETAAVVEEAPVEKSSERPIAFVIDDEKMVRVALARTLRVGGLEPREFSNGADALSILEAGAPVTVVLLDLTMPGQNGHQVLAEIRKLHPTLPVVLCSGYHATVPASDAKCTAIQKPFTYQQLREALERVGVAMMDLDAPS